MSTGACSFFAVSGSYDWSGGGGGLTMRSEGGASAQFLRASDNRLEFDLPILLLLSLLHPLFLIHLHDVQSKLQTLAVNELLPMAEYQVAAPHRNNLARHPMLPNSCRMTCPLQLPFHYVRLQASSTTCATC